MTKLEATRIVVLNRLREMQASPIMPVSLYELSTPIISEEFTKEQVLRALFSLHTDQVIQIMDDRYVRVMHYMVEPSLESVD